jgi:hypothetical protein
MVRLASPVAVVVEIDAFRLAAAAAPNNQASNCPSDKGTAASAIEQQYAAHRAELEQRKHTEDQLYQTNLHSCQQPNVSPRCSAQAAARHAEALAEIAKALKDLDASEHAVLAVAGAAGYQPSSTCKH